MNAILSSVSSVNLVSGWVEISLLADVVLLNLWIIYEFVTEEPEYPFIMGSSGSRKFTRVVPISLTSVPTLYVQIYNHSP